MRLCIAGLGGGAAVCVSLHNPNPPSLPSLAQLIRGPVSRQLPLRRKVHTIERGSRTLRVVGFALLALFLDPRDGGQPLSRSIADYVLNYGTFQVRTQRTTSSGQRHRGMVCRSSCAYNRNSHLGSSGLWGMRPYKRAEGHCERGATSVGCHSIRHGLDRIRSFCIVYVLLPGASARWCPINRWRVAHDEPR